MSVSARFVVVGGGVVAAAVAYHLARSGASVVVVEGDQAGTATNAGAGIICPWTAPLEDACYRLCCEGARHYPGLLAMLADDGEAETGYARTGTLWVAEPAGAPHEMAVLLRRRPGTPDMGELTALAPGEPTRLFPPLAPRLGGLWIGGGARVDGRAIRDSLLRAAVRRGMHRVAGNARLTRTAGRVTGVMAGGSRIGATREQAGFRCHTTVGGIGGLLAAAAGLAPGLRDAELLETRVGFRPVTSDGRPLLGQLADGLIVAAGHGPEGLTAGPWSGLAVAQLAVGQQTVTDLTPFDPSRFGPGGTSWAPLV